MSRDRSVFRSAVISSDCNDDPGTFFSLGTVPALSDHYFISGHPSYASNLAPLSFFRRRSVRTCDRL